MYWDVEVTSEEEEELIRKIAEKMHSYGMDVPAIILLESVKPLTYIGSQMGRVFVSPFLPIFGDEIGLTGEKLLRVFEKRENVEKILNHLEEMSREEERKKSEKKSEESEQEKKGWRRFLPF